MQTVTFFRSFMILSLFMFPRRRRFVATATGKMVVRANVALLVLHLPQVRDQRLKCSQIVVASEMELVFM